MFAETASMSMLTLYDSECKPYIDPNPLLAWLYTVLNPTKAAGGVWWIWYSSKCKASMAWLYTVLNPTKAAGGVWWIWYSSKCKASMAWLYTVLNPTKAAGGVWWIWYSSKCKASMAWLYTVLNPTKAAGGVWWIWGTLANAKHPWLGYTQSWIQQKQPVEFDGFGTAANAKHPSLGYTVQSWIQQKQPGGVWWIWYSSKCKASMAWLYTVLNPTKAAGGVWWIWGTYGYMLYSLGLYCGVLNPSKSGKIRRRILDHGGFGVVMFLFNVAFMSGVIATLATLDNGPLN